MSYKSNLMTIATSLEKIANENDENGFNLAMALLKNIANHLQFNGADNNATAKKVYRLNLIVSEAENTNIYIIIEMIKLMANN
jgi:hypothetical protein